MKVIIHLLFFLSYSALGQEKLSGELERISKHKFEAMVSGNFKSLADLLHPNLRYVHSNGWVETKEDVLENIRSGKLVYHSIEILETEVRSGDGFAVLIGRGIFTVSLDGKPMALELKFTEVYVYVRKVKQWLLYSRHANRMPEIN
jgi:hypothetical protein